MPDSRIPQSEGDDEPLVTLSRDSDSRGADELEAPFIEPPVSSPIISPTGRVEVKEEVREPFVVNDGSAAEEPVPQFVCGSCGGSFSADRVYDAGGGQFICTNCFMQQTSSPQVSSAAPTEKLSRPKPKVAVSARSPENGSVSGSSGHVGLLARITCPHCWHRFASDQILWVSRHVDLLGDPVLGPEAPSRFLPSRFNADGDAVDARDMPCHTLACPRCHLLVPRMMLESEPLFASIIGVSGSGKSYFSTAMTWELRRLLPKYLGVAFNDTDATINRTINQFEETLFLQDDPDKPVQLEKTDVVGSHLYDQIRLGQQVINLPKPFLFTMTPLRGHPIFGAEDSTRLICLYDNAGEHFNPGEDAASSPVTQHLSRSRAILFLYDPTQDPRFRLQLRGRSNDPQLDSGSSPRRQETILIEAGSRLRRFAAMAPNEPNRRPLLVVVPKADVWGGLINLDLSTEPLVAGAAAGGRLAAVDLLRIEETSVQIRELLNMRAPEFVAAAEAFSSYVIYIPTSALGCSPQVRDGHPGLWVRPRDLRPRWVTVPILYMLAKWSHGLIHRAQLGLETA